MANHPHDRRFIFHGNATPFGARIVSIDGKPFFAVVEGPPCTSLTVVGGHHRAQSAGGRYDAGPYKDTFKWGTTFAESKGEELDNGHHVTTVTACIEEVSAKNGSIVFSARKLCLSTKADHGPDGQPEIVFTDITVQGLELDGKPVELEIDDDFSKFPTFAQFEREYRKNENFFKKYQTRLTHGTGGKFGEKLPRTTSGHAGVSFVNSIRWNGKKIKGSVLTLKGFGKIHFGEVLMKDNNRRGTLVRLAMGSGTGGQAGAAAVDPNGSWS